MPKWDHFAMQAINSRDAVELTLVFENAMSHGYVGISLANSSRPFTSCSDEVDGAKPRPSLSLLLALVGVCTWGDDRLRAAQNTAVAFL